LVFFFNGLSDGDLIEGGGGGGINSLSEAAGSSPTLILTCLFDGVTVVIGALAVVMEAMEVLATDTTEAATEVPMITEI
jgi:hypothetical protein